MARRIAYAITTRSATVPASVSRVMTIHKLGALLIVRIVPGLVPTMTLTMRLSMSLTVPTPLTQRGCRNRDCQEYRQYYRGQRPFTGS